MSAIGLTLAFVILISAHLFRQSRPQTGVQRRVEDYFDASPAAVASAARAVLARPRRYRKTCETRKDSHFETSVRPPWGPFKWLMLGTRMTIDLQALSTGTQVIATTKSQTYISGDVGGFYTRYLHDFLSELRNELQ